MRTQIHHDLYIFTIYSLRKYEKYIFSTLFRGVPERKRFLLLPYKREKSEKKNQLRPKLCNWKSATYLVLNNNLIFKQKDETFIKIITILNTG